ncbi:hypothetical protein [Actinoplanes sp. NPDC049118]|uniref:hypothetical protein n=1 Tax=Actinoplanes sp. NPDC049118 TaxID=3155769 RepID=UPI0033D0A254
MFVAQPAQAAIDLSSVTLSTTTVVLDGDAGCGNRVNVTVKVFVPTAEQENLFSVTSTAVAPNGDSVDFLLMNQKSRSGDYATYGDSVYLCGFDAPGRYRLDTEVVWWDDAISGTRQEDNSQTFYVKRPTTLTYNATPEPAKRGTNLTHKGRLMFDPFGYGKLYGPSGQTLKISFKKTGTSAYVAKGTVKTTSGGYYSKKLRTDADGTWRVEYPANNYRQTQAKGDYVDTK